MTSGYAQIKAYNSVSDLVDTLIDYIENGSCNAVSVIADIDRAMDILKFMHNENILALDYVGISEPLWLYEPICMTINKDYVVSVDAIKNVFGDYIESGADAVLVYDSATTCNYMNYLNKNNSDYELFTIND